MAGRTNERLRVVVCGTGTVGAHAARAVLGRDDLELVGAKVYSDAKRGKDIGELLAGARTGIAAVRSIEEVVAAKPDCVIYAPSAPQHEEIFQLLAAGVNVVTTAGGYLFYPFADAQLTAALEQACQQGRSSFCGAGVNPGFVSARLPLVLSSWCRRIDRVFASECAVMVHYPSAALLFDLMHFGQPLDPKNCEKGQIGQRIRVSFEAMVREIADGLGAKLETIVQSYKEAAAPVDLHVAAGVVPAGTVAAQQWRWTGMVEGKPLIELETNWLLTQELEGWPTKFGWTFAIDGDPGLDVTLYTRDGESPDDECCIATAMQAVNVLPLISAAAPGVRTFLDLPPIYGRYQP